MCVFTKICAGGETRSQVLAYWLDPRPRLAAELLRLSSHARLLRKLVPEERLELSRVAPHDFESCAYTIPPLRQTTYKQLHPHNTSLIEAFEVRCRHEAKAAYYRRADVVG
ncbi:MAG: hypothetical protein JWM46_426 [Candidatus Kaiserbacteria bacterium]|nr:hypothetical protein [Candidatus Kaiserbacteria bacterium]